MTLWSLGNGHFNLLRFLIPPKITQLKHDFVVLFGVKNIYNKIMILLCYLGMEKIHNEIMILLCYLEVKKPQQKHNFVVLFRGKKYTTKSWFHCVIWAWKKLHNKNMIPLHTCTMKSCFHYVFFHPNIGNNSIVFLSKEHFSDTVKRHPRD